MLVVSAALWVVAPSAPPAGWPTGSLGCRLFSAWRNFLPALHVARLVIGFGCALRMLCSRIPLSLFGLFGCSVFLGWFWWAVLDPELQGVFFFGCSAFCRWSALLPGGVSLGFGGSASFGTMRALARDYLSFTGRVFTAAIVGGARLCLPGDPPCILDPPGYLCGWAVGAFFSVEGGLAAGRE